MATILSEAAGLIDEMLANPPREVLDDAGMHRLAIEASSFFKQQLGASGHLLSGTFFEIDPPSQDFLLNQDGFNRATYAHRRINNDTDRWEKIDIVDIEDLDNEVDLGNFAISFYGNPPTCRMSWDPSLVELSHIKVWYDSNGTEPTTQDTDLNLPIDILKYMIAHKGVLLALPRLAMKAPKVFTGDVIKTLSAVSNGALAEYQQEFDLWRFDREEEGWSQVEGFDDQYRYAQKRRRFF